MAANWHEVLQSDPNEVEKFLSEHDPNRELLSEIFPILEADESPHNVVQKVGKHYASGAGSRDAIIDRLRDLVAVEPAVADPAELSDVIDLLITYAEQENADERFVEDLNTINPDHPEAPKDVSRITRDLTQETLGIPIVPDGKDCNLNNLRSAIESLLEPAEDKSEPAPPADKAEDADIDQPDLTPFRRALTAWHARLFNLEGAYRALVGDFEQPQAEVEIGDVWEEINLFIPIIESVIEWFSGVSSGPEFVPEFIRNYDTRAPRDYRQPRRIREADPEAVTQIAGELRVKSIFFLSEMGKKRGQGGLAYNADHAMIQAYAEVLLESDRPDFSDLLIQKESENVDDLQPVFDRIEELETRFNEQPILNVNNKLVELTNAIAILADRLDQLVENQGTQALDEVAETIAGKIVTPEIDYVRLADEVAPRLNLQEPIEIAQKVAEQLSDNLSLNLGEKEEELLEALNRWKEIVRTIRQERVEFRREINELKAIRDSLADLLKQEIRPLKSGIDNQAGEISELRNEIAYLNTELAGLAVYVTNRLRELSERTQVVPVAPLPQPAENGNGHPPTETPIADDSSDSLRERVRRRLEGLESTDQGKDN